VKTDCDSAISQRGLAQCRRHQRALARRPRPDRPRQHPRAGPERLRERHRGDRHRLQPTPDRDCTGIEIERREAGTDTWSVVLHQPCTKTPGFDSATATVCDPLPADGRTYEYRARTYDAAGNHSPSGEVRAMTVSAG
jgi:hypothetical protein